MGEMLGSDSTQLGIKQQKLKLKLGSYDLWAKKLRGLVSMLKAKSHFHHQMERPGLPKASG